MYTLRSIRLFAARSVAVIALAASSLAPALAAGPSCDSKHSASHFPVLGSADAVLYYKTPYLIGPAVEAKAEDSKTHFPEPGSAEAGRLNKTPYLNRSNVDEGVEGSKSDFPEPGSAEAVTYYKTPYLMDHRSAADSSCP